MYQWVSGPNPSLFNFSIYGYHYINRCCQKLITYIENYPNIYGIHRDKKITLLHKETRQSLHKKIISWSKFCALVFKRIHERSFQNNITGVLVLYTSPFTNPHASKILPLSKHFYPETEISTCCKIYFKIPPDKPFNPLVPNSLHLFITFFASDSSSIFLVIRYSFW